MVANTVTEERSSKYEFCNNLSLYMSILHNCRGLVNTYLPMINYIVLVGLGQHVSAAITLTCIAVFQVYG